MSLARQAAIILCAAFPLWAAPALTTIQDTIYKADGTKFNGIAVISWNTFDANDTSHIGMQSTTIRIVNGFVFVQLVPNANATPLNDYTVQYNSDGKQQYVETWSVPPSTTPLRIKDVNIAASTTSGSGGNGGGVASPPTSNPIAEADVTGLVTDLSLRPVKGSSYANGGAAMIDTNGALDMVQGNLTDCVRVDGSATACFDPTQIPSLITNETPGGVVDGSNATFTLANTVSPAGSLALYRNGLLLQSGVDYNLQAGGSILFVSAAVPQPGDILLANYQDNAPSDLISDMSSSYAAQNTAGSTGPQILCSAAGTSTTSSSAVSLGSCVVSAGALSAGDRLEVRFNLKHLGTANGFVFSVLWGGTPMVQRTASTSDSIVTGHGDAVVTSTGANLDMQTWGSTLPLQATVAAASDALTGGIKIDFQAAMSAAGTDSLTLANYTVLRYPAQ